MNDRRSIKAKGPPHFDLLGMSDEAFETMNARLIRLEYPDAFKPANVSDGGADMVLPKEDGSGYARCWQSKHYPKKIGVLDIRVDYWNGEELQAHLTGSEPGERIARRFFDDAESDRERTYQAI